MLPPYYVYPFCVLFIVVGIITFILGVRKCREAGASSSWASTIGTVTARKIVENAAHEGGKTYQPVVSYKYIVEGRYYTGKRIAVLDIGSSLRYAKNVLKKYRVGRDVKVYYDTAEPRRSVLKIGLDGNILGVPFLGLFFASVGTILALIYYFR